MVLCYKLQGVFSSYDLIATYVLNLNFYWFQHFFTTTTYYGKIGLDLNVYFNLATKLKLPNQTKCQIPKGYPPTPLLPSSKSLIQTSLPTPF